ncbi:MAG TPA: SRPBCC domain-containing protein [Gaiellales bacterium]|jgi:uncharacterized protein YndB with AHSA1/START domain|nr:SRPBCC domain-containing protein [Gaiellales bacterium]
MPDILFRFDVDAPAATVLAALKTADGIKGFWTSRAQVPSEVGETLELGFAIAPAPFDLRLEQSDQSSVSWRTLSFPPHWVGTTIRWDVEPREGGCTVSFRHADFRDDADAGHAAYTWGQIMTRLKEFAETTRPDPVFA